MRGRELTDWRGQEEGNTPQLGMVEGRKTGIEIGRNICNMRMNSRFPNKNATIMISNDNDKEIMNI